MKRISCRNWLSILASSTALLFSLSVAAQVLETPQTYTLDTNTPDINDEDGIPITLDAGVIAGLNSQIGNVPLNDVAVASNPVFTPISGSIGTGSNTLITGQFWSLVHTSESDTRALAVASPVNVTLANGCENRYNYPTSLQILDLTGDGLNDLAFMGPPCNVDSGFDEFSNIWGLQGNASDPFQDADSLTVLGNNLGGSFYPANSGGQLALVQADFNGDGLIDLGYYNLDFNDGANSLQTLLNDGNFGLMPTQVSPIDGPVVPPNSDSIRGVVIVAGDFDGNGTQDIAVAYTNFSDTEVSELQIYSGNGDGTFAQTAMAQANLEANDTDTSLQPRGMASGNFDGNDFSDFAVTWIDDDGGSFITTALCDGSQCNTSTIVSPGLTTRLGTTIVAGDFNSDGLDDIANIQNVDPILFGSGVRTSSVTLRLNNGGGFDSTIDQTLTLDQTGFDNSNLPQLVAENLDACGGPDLAFTGYVYNLDKIAEGTDDFEFQTGVAFNINEPPTANAGEPTQVTGGVQVGGTTGNPTCSDPTDDAMEISWTVLSGEATLNNSTVANPIVTEASSNAVLQVTCTDPCGASATSTVTLPAVGFIQGSCTSLTGVASVPFNLTWLMIPAALGFMGAIRRKKS